MAQCSVCWEWCGPFALNSLCVRCDSYVAGLAKQLALSTPMTLEEARRHVREKLEEAKLNEAS